ncbi:MAG: glutamine amidotransferase [Ardenticatenaceae bacterium]|nr:glutamine amidotransferase [Ardenticatenaceae bacterium]
MATGDTMPAVLLVGESWLSYSVHIKGFNNFPTAYYEEGLAPLANALNGFARLTHLPGHLAATAFPFVLDALQQYDVILFSDVGSDTLLLHPDTFLRSQVRANRLRLLQQYVHQGAGFAMLGGYMSFGGYEGKAHYHGGPVEELLPVEISPFDDRVETPEGIRPEPVDATHPILAGVEGLWPRLLGYNRLTAKADAQTLLRHGRDPFLVVGYYGRGRTAAYASDVSPHWGSEEFINWTHYTRFWRQLVGWLAQIES